MKVKDFISCLRSMSFDAALIIKLQGESNFYLSQLKCWNPIRSDSVEKNTSCSSALCVLLNYALTILANINHYFIFPSPLQEKRVQIITPKTPKPVGAKMFKCHHVALHSPLNPLLEKGLVYSVHSIYFSISVFLVFELRVLPEVLQCKMCFAGGVTCT